jgi:glutamate-ammonia-ligase adenylyltransferase
MADFSLSSALIALPEQLDPLWRAAAEELCHATIAELDDPGLKTWVESSVTDQQWLDFTGFVFSHSPFLANCAQRDMAFLRDVFEHGPDTCFSRLIDDLKDDVAQLRDRDILMRELRITRRRVALLTGLADLAGHWPLDKVTSALSDFADGALSATFSHLLLQAADAGEIVLADPHFPEDQCGYVALSMGKHGARELNYSSDIDLIILYEPTQIDYRGKRSHQQFVERLTKQMITILQEVTADGYVCRVDLNLRPDPSATPLAVSIAAARNYYRSRGQNWERAAMIKARPTAGDLALGQQFLDDLSPFIWREAMDFWLLQDMAVMKRRINEHKGGSEIAVAGHNVKLGRGGIREVEFYAQTQQLIYGGMDAYLRCPRTLEALTTLAEAGHIDDKVADDLTESYEFLRRLEHRLQMVDDRQTQTMPTDPAGVRRMAALMAFDDVEAFAETLLERLTHVSQHFNRLFENAPDDATGGADWNFAANTPDQRMTALIEALGFADTGAIYDRLGQWHRAGFRFGQNQRAQDMLRQLIPDIARVAARFPDPAGALAALEDFLAGLPSGLRFLSTISAHPSLLQLVLEILTLAPALAARVTRHCHRLQLATTSGFFDVLPVGRIMRAESADINRRASDRQEAIEHLGSWAHDYRFQVAVNLLRHQIDAYDAGLMLSNLADAIVEQAAMLVTGDEQGQPFPPARICAVAVGAWGSRDLTSDGGIDLLFLHQQSDAGPQTCRWARRLTGLCMAHSMSGALCTVETSATLWGGPGPLVTSLDLFIDHLRGGATAEQLIALLELRVVTGPDDFRSQIETAIQDLLISDIAADALIDPARARIDALAVGSDEDAFQLVDNIRLAVDTAMRALQLRHASETAEVLTPSITRALAALAQHGYLDADLARHALDARHRLRQIDAMQSVRFGGRAAGTAVRRGPMQIDVQIDAEFLLAAGVIDVAEWRIFLGEAIALLGAIRDGYLS